MLFVTNFLAILLAGGLVFLLLGLGRLAPSAQRAQVRRHGFALVALSTLAVAALLGAVSYRVVPKMCGTPNCASRTISVPGWPPMVSTLSPGCTAP